MGASGVSDCETNQFSETGPNAAASGLTFRAYFLHRREARARSSAPCRWPRCIRAPRSATPPARGGVQVVLYQSSAQIEIVLPHVHQTCRDPPGLSVLRSVVSIRTCSGPQKMM